MTIAYVSAIGHEAAAQVFNGLFPCLDNRVTVNRIAAKFENGDKAIAIKLIGRAPEGAILTIDEMEQIGYELYLIRFFNLPTTEIHAVVDGNWTAG